MSKTIAHADLRISTRSSSRAALDASMCSCVPYALRARAPRFSGLLRIISAVRCDFSALSVCALSVSVSQGEHGSEVRGPVRHLYTRLKTVRSNHKTSIWRPGRI